MPDLNSVPPSPHPRRASAQQMPPPPLPSSSSSTLDILPSNQSTVNNTGSSPSLPSPHLPTATTMTATSLPTATDNAAVGTGPGPVRHPRPLTAADLHMQLEKEQEAVHVNRLTRELTILRAAHNASVVSNASSTSASASGAEIPTPSDTHLTAGPGLAHHRTPVHHRTSSNASTRSFVANVGSVSTASIPGISSPAPVRPGQPTPLGGISLSRQGSSASRRSRAPSPSPSTDPSFIHRMTPGSEMSPGILPGTSRYEETAFYRAELDNVKKENEALKRKVRELERMIRDRRPSDASRASATAALGRTRSDSVSTTASVSVAASTTGVGGVSVVAQRERPRVVSMMSTAGSVGVGVPEEEVRVGESAASAGIGRGEGN